MADFQLDTSGEIIMARDPNHRGIHRPTKRWSDLSPFVQGYVGAALKGLTTIACHDHHYEPGAYKVCRRCGKDAPRAVRFSDLAHETLARIIEDCERFTRDIVTSFVYPPIPVRCYDWCAYFDGEEERGQYGWGEDEEAAKADLIANWGPDE